MLIVENIDVYYGEVQVVTQVSFDIKKGEITALLGSNGAGKTTTVSAVSGILTVASGSIQFMEKDITGVEAYKRVEMGLVQVPEGRRVFPTLSVRENLEMGSYLKGPKQNRSESMDFVSELFPILSKRRRQAAGTLSGGEQQMLAIARGLMAKPTLLILDEPSLGLAPVIVDLIFEAIQRINSEGMTTLLVEQNVSRTLEIADRGFVLEEGCIAITGSGESLLSNPHVKQIYLGL